MYGLVSLGRWDFGTTAEPIHEWFWVGRYAIRGDKLAEMFLGEIVKLCRKGEKDG